MDGMVTLTTRLIAAACLFVPLDFAQADDSVTYVAALIVAPDGSLGGAASVVVSGGRITSVSPGAGGDANGPSGKDRLIRFDEGTVLCPGFIDVVSALGVLGTNTARAESLDAALSARTALDPRHEHFAGALEAGYTAALLWPNINNVIAGTTAPVSIGPRRNASLIADDGPLVFVLGSSALESTREPTSRLGAIDLLRRALAGATGGEAGADQSGTDVGGARLRRFANGKLPGIVFCESAADVSSALDLFSGIEPLPTLVHTNEAADVASELGDRARGALVVVGPLSPWMSPRTLSGPGELERAGVQVAFGAGLPASPWDSLRTTAALAARYGLSANAARRAMTVNAARAAGLEASRGSIAAGMIADFVLLSGDPLRPDSRVLEVYLGGVRVYDARAFDD